MLFIEKDTKQIVELPDHFLGTWIARNYEPYVEPVEKPARPANKSEEKE